MCDVKVQGAPGGIGLAPIAVATAIYDLSDVGMEHSCWTCSGLRPSSGLHLTIIFPIIMRESSILALFFPSIQIGCSISKVVPRSHP